MVLQNFGHDGEYISFQRKLLDKLGYFGISTTRIKLNTSRHQRQDFDREVDYKLVGNTDFGYFMYFILHVNVSVKGIFLFFVVTESFGPVAFLDKITSLDFILCTGLVVIGAFVFLKRYPFYEILEATWTLLNKIYLKSGSASKIRLEVDHIYKSILITHLIIIFGGCTALMIQYFPDPKYCNFTYSTFTYDSWYLRGLFGLHEFCFMMMAWNGYAGPSSLSMFQGVAISKIIDKMNETLQHLYRDKMRCQRVLASGRGYVNWVIRREALEKERKAPGTEYDIDHLLKDYRKLMMICDRLNDSVAYKTLFLHICGGSQFVSDVFAATHVLKLPGTGFLDVWFYVWDSMSAGFMLLRVYHFMGMVSDASEMFLASLNEYLTFPIVNRSIFRKKAKTLKLITLNVSDELHQSVSIPKQNT